MPLNADRTLVQKAAPVGPEFGHSVAAGYVVYRGSICAVCSDGTIVPAGSAAPNGETLVAIVGLAQRMQNNLPNQPVVGEQFGPGPVWVVRGTWGLPFADAAPTWANFGQPVYAVDDQSVSLTETPSGGTARLQVGTFAGLDLDGNPFVTF